MFDIDERIKEEYDAMLIAVFPSEKRQHARRLVELELERDKGLGLMANDVREDGE